MWYGITFFPVLFFAFFLFLITLIWKPLKPEITIAVCCVMIVSIFGRAINKAYHDSFERIDEQVVNLRSYDPFREGTLTASLDKPSTLTLMDNLPRLDGATALYPVYSAFVRAVYSADKVNEEKRGADKILDCNGTPYAYTRLIRGQTDIIFAAGPSEEQLKMAKDAGMELYLTPIGREAFVFFVNTKNPVNGLSINDIQKIYSGEIRNWREFGGKNSAIRAFQRPGNSGSQTALIGFMGDIPLMTPPEEDVAGDMGGIVSRVASYRNYGNAIGYSFLFFATEMVNDNKIKLLELNGIAPTRENVANRTYPYAAEFYAVTSGTENPNADRLIEWILSEQGQYLIDKTGYTPLYRTAPDSFPSPNPNAELRL